MITESFQVICSENFEVAVGEATSLEVDSVNLSKYPIDF